MVQESQPTTKGAPDRITPIRRGWKHPRYQPRPDSIAIFLIIVLFIDFTDRIYDDFATDWRIFNWKALALLATFGAAIWGVWRLSQGAIAYYEANPWIRRGNHQHRYSRKARDEFYDTFYHDHRWAFPFHKYVLYKKHRHH